MVEWLLTPPDLRSEGVGQNRSVCLFVSQQIHCTFAQVQDSIPSILVPLIGL